MDKTRQSLIEQLNLADRKIADIIKLLTDRLVEYPDLYVYETTDWDGRTEFWLAHRVPKTDKEIAREAKEEAETKARNDRWEFAKYQELKQRFDPETA